ncbi:MAG: ABC transporter ATP-binding protein [Bacillota bacterium]
MMPGEPLVQVKNLHKCFSVKSRSFGSRSYLKAVEGVSFNISRGETLGLVGESGCGKTTVGRTIIQLLEPTAGEVIFAGQNITCLPGRQMFSLRRRMQMIFQDPFASLNPRMTVGDIVGEPLDVHGLARGKERTRRIYSLLDRVGLLPEHAGRFPHEFSGGQRQRIGIARALAVEPEFIICDEPISALDVSIQAQVVNMLQDLQKEMNLTYLFIAHDLSMVRYISNRVAVMYLGKIMEIAPSDDLYANPLHPYTQALLSAIPIADPVVEREKRRIILEGELPDPLNPPGGCRFRTRCPQVGEQCTRETPLLREIGEGHQVACHRVVPAFSY